MTGPIDRPILFSGPMVRALIAGRKTQTRRILKPQPKPFAVDEMGTLCDVGLLHVEGDPLPRVTTGRVITRQQVRFAVGDRLWVREAWQLHARASDVCTVVYRASIDGGWMAAHEQFADILAGDMQPKAFQSGWRSPIHMPRWASRLTLTVTDVRVERLQEISEADARAEGAPQLATDGEGVSFEFPTGTHRCGFAGVWEQIHGPAAWDLNSWVVAVSFSARQGNIEAAATAA